MNMDSGFLSRAKSKKSSVKKYTRVVAKCLIFILLISYLIYTPTTKATNSLTSAKDTLSNDRPSVSTTLNGAAAFGATTITVVSTLGFAPGDTAVLASSTNPSVSETKIVSSVISLTQLSFTAGITSAGGFSSGAPVYLEITSTHTIVFNTSVAVTGGKFVLTLAGSTTPNTTTPSSTGFVFNGINTTTDFTVAGFSTSTPGISTSTSSGNLIFTFPFTGTIASGTNATITIGSIHFLENPTKTAVSGTADTWSFEMDEDDSGSNLISSTQGKVATIESVAVSATVAPTLNFTINPVNGGTSIAGLTTTATTTATSVPFGTLALNATTTAAQYIHIDSNSNSGYIVTAQENTSLAKTNGQTIVDLNSSAPAENTGVLGFGYALQNKNNTPAAFLYNASSRTFNSIGFSSVTPYTIMSNSGPASADEAYVDYYVRIGSTQPQGTYQNLITYIATATY
jgi:hypothetical protein